MKIGFFFFFVYSTLCHVTVCSERSWGWCRVLVTFDGLPESPALLQVQITGDVYFPLQIPFLQTQFYPLTFRLASTTPLGPTLQTTTRLFKEFKCQINMSLSSRLVHHLRNQVNGHQSRLQLGQNHDELGQEVESLIPVTDRQFTLVNPSMKTTTTQSNVRQSSTQ